MLDMDFGFFPNVTRSNTTSKNAWELSRDPDEEEVFYVTRSYLTRHGNGYLPGEKGLNLRNAENETNKSHPFQGECRTAPLNLDLMRYAIGLELNLGPKSENVKRNLVITCCDQYDINVDKLLNDLQFDFNKVFVSNGPSLENITEHNAKW